MSDNLYYRSAGNKATPNIYAVEDKSYIIIKFLNLKSNDELIEKIESIRRQLYQIASMLYR